MAAHIPRIWLAETLEAGAPVTLTDEGRLHHLRDVLRLKPGNPVSLFNAGSGEYTATVANVARHAITFTLGTQQRAARTPIARHVFFAPLKRQNTEWLVEKVTELGTTHLHPIITAHTQVRSVNTQRLQAIAIDAVEQSGQLHVPQVASAVDMMLAIQQAGALTILAALEPQHDVALPPLHTVLSQHKGAVGMLIGPEGGFSADEVAALRKQPNIVPVSLGPSVLRAETAAILAAGLLHTYTADNE